MTYRWIPTVWLAGAACLAHGTDNSPTDQDSLETVVVEGRRVNLVGEAMSASQGLAGSGEIRLRPLLRTGEILELVPGMVVTQHSGTGKANQYFLRGFNLDHGTDFATWIDGMPVNMRTHGHGQGYTDLNFLIPETVASIAYKKGAYYAEVGDFSGAGSASLTTVSRVDRGQVELTAGEDGYYRALALNSLEAGGGQWFAALEANTYDGPWLDIEEDLEKINLLLKYSRELAGGRLQLSAMGYDNQWNSADQIPLRAVANARLDDLGSIDDSVGGDSSRYSISGNWQRDGAEISAYAIRYDMNLWSNFTYFLEDETDGDQFEQVDERWIVGGRASYQWTHNWADTPVVNRLGAEIRRDDIDEVGLHPTRERRRLGTIRSDEVTQVSAGLYWENQVAWSDQLRSIIGLRYDYFDFEVDSRIGVNTRGVDLRPNSGGADDDLVSLKGSLIYAFSKEWEGYISAGQGFHSNDARGTTIAVDPGDGTAVETVDPLVASLGYEMGLRGFWNARLNTSIALWHLELDSELLFVGDAGNTEASGESRRRGVELTAYYRLGDNWTLDLEYAYTDAEFIDSPASGDKIPGAIEEVLQAGIGADFTGGWFGGLRLRHFGERPLVEDGSVTSDTSTVVNLRAGYRWRDWTLRLDLLNLFDSDDHDIDYFYPSRLADEPSGVATEDIHYHVLEPRTARLSVGRRF